MWTIFNILIWITEIYVFVFQFFLSVLHDSIPPELRSGMESLIRPESVVQQKSETKADTFSLAEPMPNMPARLQVSGS